MRVPADCLLGGVEGRGLQQALSALEVGRINVAARAVGLAQAAYDAASRYSRNDTPSIVTELRATRSRSRSSRRSSSSSPTWPPTCRPLAC